MKTMQSPRQAATQTPAETASAIAPPPPARCAQLISGVFFLAVFLIAAPAAEAQTARTITVTATSAGGASLDANGNITVNEGETITYTLRLDAALSDGIAIINNATFDGTARNGVDYTSNTDQGGVYNFAAATFDTSTRLQREAMIDITDDSAAEGAETITWTLAVDPSSTTTDTVTITPSSFRVTIAANDDYAATTVAIANASAVNEGAPATFTVTFTEGNPAPSYPVRVAYTAAITDCDSANVMLPGGRLDFTSSQTTSRDITVRIPSAANCDDGETGTLAVTITPPTGVTATDNMGTATVNYITAAHTIGVADQMVDEGAAMVTVTRAGPALTSDAPITWTVTHDGGTADADDFNGGLTGTVTFSGASASQTITVPIADDSLSEGDETFTLTLSAAAAVLASNNQIALSPAAATITITDGDAITAMSMTVRGPATVNEESSAVYTVDLGAEVTGSSDVTVAITTAGTATLTTDYTLSANSVTISAGASSATFTLTTTDGGGDGTDDRTLTLTLTAMGGANTAGMASVTQTITITEDDPVARSARVEAPTAAVAKGIGQLASQAVVQRLRFNAGTTGNTLTVAGRDMAGNGMETLAAQYLAGGRELSAAELLRQSGFSFTGGDGGRGFNFWGDGSYVSADGDHDGVTYDGDTTAFHLGVDTNWRDGLIGVAVGTSDGDTDFTVTADGMTSTLETDVTSVHPYLTRRFNNSQLYFTAGYGSGDAELKEDNATIKTDLTVTTAAFGISHALGDQLAARVSALYSRAELDAATGDGKTLPATDADSTRLTAGLEAAWLAGPWRLFLASDARHDSGDGDTGGALDLGGGVEWKSPTVFVRLEGGGHLLGQDAVDESRVSFTARKTTGRVTLGLNLAADATGLDTARLLHGEWRF